jgi:hypothetical protein
MYKQNSSKTNPLSKTDTGRKYLSEKHIQATCSDWLALDGWRLIRTDLPHLRGLGVSELGIADSLYIRYGFPNETYFATALVMWVEWKRIKRTELKHAGFTGFREGPTKKSKHQADWHDKERARGALTLIAGEDFPASIEGFCEWYAASGLQRKSISIPR